MQKQLFLLSFFCAASVSAMDSSSNAYDIEYVKSSSEGDFLSIEAVQAVLNNRRKKEPSYVTPERDDAPLRSSWVMVPLALLREKKEGSMSKNEGKFKRLGSIFTKKNTKKLEEKKKERPIFSREASHYDSRRVNCESDVEARGFNIEQGLNPCLLRNDNTSNDSMFEGDVFASDFGSQHDHNKEVPVVSVILEKNSVDRGVEFAGSEGVRIPDFAQGDSLSSDSRKFIGFAEVMKKDERFKNIVPDISSDDSHSSDSRQIIGFAKVMEKDGRFKNILPDISSDKSDELDDDFYPTSPIAGSFWNMDEDDAVGRVVKELVLKK